MTDEPRWTRRAAGIGWSSAGHRPAPVRAQSVRGTRYNPWMPDTPSITLVKQFDYRGATEEWSNTYHFNGDTPGNEAEWKALGLAIYATEKAILRSDVKLCQLYGYEAGNNTSVAQIDLRIGTDALIPGTLSMSGIYPLSGDQAVSARARIGVSSTGKKVYVCKYWHGSGKASTATADGVASAAASAMETHVAAMLDGSLPGDAVWSGPQGQEAIDPFVRPYVTTRTLKRRGKRNP